MSPSLIVINHKSPVKVQGYKSETLLSNNKAGRFHESFRNIVLFTGVKNLVKMKECQLHHCELVFARQRPQPNESKKASIIIVSIAALVLA